MALLRNEKSRLMMRVLRRLLSEFRWWSATRRHSSFVSFALPLRQLCRCLSPSFVLEFGPGLSTSILLRHTEAEIVSVETDLRWYQWYCGVFESPRLHLVHAKEGWQLRELYLERPVIPLVFIDGGNRLAELIHCYSLIGMGGVVLLHDAHREEFELGLRKYPFVYFPEFHSCVLTRNEDLHLRVQEHVPRDFSRPSAYVSSQERQQYLSRFLR